MFPRLEQGIRARLDLLVEFSTLGEYRVTGAGELVPASACGAPERSREHHRRTRGERCGPPWRHGAPYGVCVEEREL